MVSVTLIQFPPSLRKGIKRRLPRNGKYKDLTGKQYDRCLVLGFAGFKGPFAAWLCRCQCGSRFVRNGAALERGGREGCGCFRNKSAIPKSIRGIWSSMIARCVDPQHESYHLYGKRGIRVCKRWSNSVEAFAHDMGKRPSTKHRLVRRNNRGNFTPRNCRWGLGEEVPGRLPPRLITHGGRTLSLSGWARELGIRPEAMRLRANKCLANGWDLSVAVTTPVRRLST
jgi:hypothetical protein